MIKILAIGDSHIPRRAKNIPDQIYGKLNQLTETGKFDYTLFTGDVIKADNFMDFLHLNTKKNLFIVIGNMDYYGGTRDAPVSQKLDLPIKSNEDLVIGLTHGHQISPRGDRSQLEYLALENNYNILITGHTHKEEVFRTKKGVLLVNPGSVTGVWSFVASGNPSFVVLTINENTAEIEVILYQLNKSSSKVMKSISFYQFENNLIRTRI